MTDKKAIFDKLRNAVVDGDEDLAKTAAEEAVKAKIDSLKAMDVLREGADIVGKKFEKLEAYISDLVSSGNALKAGIEVLTKDLKSDDVSSQPRGKIIVGTVAGDIHDIGKNIVIALLSVEGYEVHDLGVDVPVKTFIEKAEEIHADIIAMSALLSASRPFMRDLINMLKARNIRDNYKVMVGGAAVDVGYAEEIQADGYGRLAPDAVNLVKNWLIGS